MAGEKGIFEDSIMKSHTIISHTADVGLKIEADSPEKLFIIALKGMNKILCRDYEKKINKHALLWQVSIPAYDMTSLLISFLSEVLTLSHIHKAIFHTVEFLEFGENYLNVRLFGAKVKNFTKDVKAVTYHEAEVKKNKKGKWETILIFDI